MTEGGRKYEKKYKRWIPAGVYTHESGCGNDKEYNT